MKMIYDKAPTLTHVSKLPKYQLFINSILERIKNGELKEGDKLPSIIEASAELNLSRDTIGRAYKELYEKGVITSIYRKGYFVSRPNKTLGLKKVLFITGKCNTYNQSLYHFFSEELAQQQIEMDCMLNHNKLSYLKEILLKEAGNYHLFIIEPQLLYKKEILKVLEMKSLLNRAVLLADDDEVLPEATTKVVLNYEEGLFEKLCMLKDSLNSYQKLNLVLPEHEYFPAALITGFFRFCDKMGISGQVLEEINKIEKGNAYFVIDERSFFAASGQLKKQRLTPGQGIGLVALFEKEYLDFMCQGVTSISWFHQGFARQFVEQIAENNFSVSHCSPKLTVRHSL